MEHAKKGDRVLVNYTLASMGGQLVDTSVGRFPLRFTIGSGEVILGLDQAVMGMETGESKHIAIPQNLGHGKSRPERVLYFKRAQAVPEPAAHPPNGSSRKLTPRAGLFVETEWPGAWVTQDYNHPLASKDLSLYVTLIAIEQDNA